MSETRSVGVIGASSWTYAACVMADHLGKVEGAGTFLPDTLPKGVHEDAKEFFRLVLEATSDAPANPGASLSNYRIATATVVGTKQPAVTDRATVDAQLKSFADLVDKLAETDQLDEPTTVVVQELREFFVRLSQEGSDQNYVDAVRFTLRS